MEGCRSNDTLRQTMIRILNLMFVQALFDYQPNAVDEQQAVAWLTLMEKAYCNFQRYGEQRRMVRI